MVLRGEEDPSSNLNLPFRMAHSQFWVVSLSGLRWFELVLTSACKFPQNKLLEQAADNMQTRVHPQILKYLPGTTIGVGVISRRNGIPNQTAAQLGVIRLPCSVVSLADKWSHHRM